MIFSKIERMIAFRYLRSSRKEGFISVIAGFSFVGIALGVATLIVVMAVMNGFRTEISKKILGLNGHISVSGYAEKIYEYDDFAKKLQQVEGVTYATAVIDAQAMVTTKYSTTGGIVKAMQLKDIMQRPMISGNIRSGNLLDFGDANGIMIGSHMALNLGVSIGDKITLISPQGRATAIGTLPRLKSYKLIATFESGMYEYDNNVIFMPLKSAQLFFQYPSSVSSIEVFTTDPHSAYLTSQKIDNFLSGRYIIRNWQEMNASLFNALKVERTVMFLILTLIVFIAAFNIISSLIMLVNDKSKDIAILRTMGATRSTIIKIFFLCGSIIGVVGTLLGLFIGVTFALNVERIRTWLESVTGSTLFDPVIYFLSQLPVDFRVEDVLWSLSMGIFFSFLATIYPSWKAAKCEPAEALRNE